MPMKKCPFCAEEIQEEAVKCRHCGSWVGSTQPPPPQGAIPPLASKRLTRSSSNRMIAGVCGGLGNYLGVDPTLVRIAYAFITIFTAVIPGFLAYIALGFIIPAEEHH